MSSYRTRRRNLVVLTAITCLLAGFVFFQRYFKRSPLDQPDHWISTNGSAPSPPVVSLESMEWPARIPDLIGSSMIDLKMLQSNLSPNRTSEEVCSEYLRYFFALWSIWESKSPFVVVCETADAAPDLTEYLPLLQKLPKRVEALVIGALPGSFSVKPGTFKNVPSEVRAVRTLTHLPSVCVFRTKALQTKLFRLLPIAHRIEFALCMVFRTFATTQFTSAHLPHALLTIPRAPKTSTHAGRMLAYAMVLPAATLYRTKTMRYFFNQPLNDRDLVQYMGHLVLLAQHHHKSEWMLVHTGPHTFDGVSLTRVEQFTAGLPGHVDCVILAFERDLLPSAVLEHLPTGVGLRRLNHPVNPSVVLYRCRSIREKWFKLFPVSHPLGIALSTQWNTYGVEPPLV